MFSLFKSTGDTVSFHGRRIRGMNFVFEGLLIVDHYPVL